MGCHLPDNPNLPTPEMFVEFAHIYADEVWSDEHSESIEVMKEYLDRHNPDGLVVSAVLIDELHVEVNTLDTNEFIRCILRRGIAPDHIVFEGRLGEAAQMIVSQISGRISIPADQGGPGCDIKWHHFKKAGKDVCFFEFTDGVQVPIITHWADGRKEWSCAILSAAWSLCRAGVIDFPKDSIVSLTAAPVYGEKIVSVLHSKYKGVEEKVARLIEAAHYQDVVDRMDLVYFG